MEQVKRAGVTPHCANGVCTAGRILGKVRGSQGKGTEHRGWQVGLGEGGVGADVLVRDE